MSEAFIIWYSIVLVVCAIIAVFIDNRDMKKKDREIHSLRVKNHALMEQNENQKAIIKFYENSNYYEEL